MEDRYSEFLKTIPRKDRKDVLDVLNLDSSIEDRLDYLSVYLKPEQIEICRKLLEDAESDDGNTSDSNVDPGEAARLLEQFHIERKTFEDKLEEKDKDIKKLQESVREKDIERKNFEDKLEGKDKDIKKLQESVREKDQTIDELRRKVRDSEVQREALARINNSLRTDTDVKNIESPFPFLQMETDKKIETIHDAVGKYEKGNGNAVNGTIELFLSPLSKRAYEEWKKELISGIPVQLSTLPGDSKKPIMDYIRTNYALRPEIKEKSLEEVMAIAFQMLEVFKEVRESKAVRATSPVREALPRVNTSMVYVPAEEMEPSPRLRDQSLPNGPTEDYCSNNAHQQHINQSIRKSIGTRVQLGTRK